MTSFRAVNAKSQQVPVVASPRMAEYGPLKLKVSTPGLLRTFGSPCSLRVLNKFLQSLEKVKLQFLINPRARLRSQDPKIKPPGPQGPPGPIPSELSSQFRTYGTKGNWVCRKRNPLQKSIVPKENQERQQEAIVQRKTDSTKSKKTSRKVEQLRPETPQRTSNLLEGTLQSDDLILQNKADADDILVRDPRVLFFLPAIPS